MSGASEWSSKHLKDRERGLYLLHFLDFVDRGRTDYISSVISKFFQHFLYAVSVHGTCPFFLLGTF